MSWDPEALPAAQRAREDADWRYLDQLDDFRAALDLFLVREPDPAQRRRAIAIALSLLLPHDAPEGWRLAVCR